MKKALVSILVLLLPLLAGGQENLYMETRLAYDVPDGFHGKYLNMVFDGQICDGLSFKYRQRINRFTTSAFLESIDWIHLNWQAAPKLCLSAGKQVVAVGGYEYDRAPIDLYYCSEFWNMIACYQMGVSASYMVSDDDRLLLQVCNSPLRDSEENEYALNLFWAGHHGLLETLWSANAFQAHDGMMYYLSLGNRLDITDRIRMDIDFTDRYNDGIGLLDDISVIAELSAEVAERVRVHGKYTFDMNQADSQRSYDFLICPGTCLNMVSGGVEWQPLKDKPDHLKLYAVGGYSWGENGNQYGVMTDKGLYAQLGVKFRMDIFKK